ncbi:DNA photolyase family protein [Halorhodospira sp. 9621]|uniref:FAD-binding domain-containing protein n=1 Tax=Halorhodospira TaxID=85108 RepID=UPI0019116884|nr:deoxyribodipyrimidine photolyase [Halorhodospira halophila]MCG5533812.1 DNA photolyase family protein [Halorhodospira sp. 9621]MCG5539314.1 DNA photolyase family protein [Halorhodospira sp. 9622]
MSTALVWLRRDLRLADQPALARAAQAAERIAPVYIHAPEEARPAAGAASLWWLHHSLAALDAELAAAGSRLCLDSGSSAERLCHWAQISDATVVYCTAIAEPWARQQEAAVAEALAGIGARLEVLPDGLLTDPSAVRNRSGTPYRAFTPFWRSVRAQLDPPRPTSPPALPGLPEAIPEPQPLEALGLLPRIRWDEKLAASWQPGTVGATQRLERFLETAATAYAEQRDYPARPGTSRLSPHLHFGEVSIRTLWHAVHDARQAQPAAAEALDTFLAELGWREFAYHLLWQQPQLHDTPIDKRFGRFAWREDPDGALLDAWRRGATGVPLVDAGMRELWATGWMHNRVRMVVGSFLVKNLRLPWQHGEAHFRDTLVDWDLASNSMGWQWVSGCGADAAPYFRVFNPVRQGERFDPDGEYVRQWVPEVAGLPKSHIHQPWAAPADTRARCGLRLGHNYPEPLVDLATSRKEALAAFQALG